jgi:hypothetical protein
MTTLSGGVLLGDTAGLALRDAAHGAKLTHEAGTVEEQQLTTRQSGAISAT